MIYITDSAVLHANTTAILTQHYDAPAKLTNVGKDQAIIEKSDDGVVWTFLVSIAPEQYTNVTLDTAFIRNNSSSDVYVYQRTQSSDSINNSEPVAVGTGMVQHLPPSEVIHPHMWKNTQRDTYMKLNDGGIVLLPAIYLGDELSLNYFSNFGTAIYIQMEESVDISCSLEINLSSLEYEKFVEVVKKYNHPYVSYTSTLANNIHTVNLVISVQSLPEPKDNNRLILPLFGGYLYSDYSPMKLHEHQPMVFTDTLP